MRIPLVPLKAIAVAGLVLAAAPAVAQGEAYHAAGTEPFWGLTIDARTMRFEAPDRATVSVRTPKVINGFAGEIYQTRRIHVNVVHAPCSDGMSDRRYRDTVSVTVDGRAYKGCGGDTSAPIPARSPVDGSWRFESIAGRPPVPGTQASISFAEGRISGSTGCNRFNGSFAVERDRLTPGPLITTRRACTRWTGKQEQALLALLGKRLEVSSTRTGKLVLKARDGRRLVLARERTSADRYGVEPRTSSHGGGTDGD